MELAALLARLAATSAVLKPDVHVDARLWFQSRPWLSRRNGGSQDQDQDRQDHSEPAGLELTVARQSALSLPTTVTAWQEGNEAHFRDPEFCRRFDSISSGDLHFCILSAIVPNLHAIHSIGGESTS